MNMNILENKTVTDTIALIYFYVTHFSQIIMRVIKVILDAGSVNRPAQPPLAPNTVTS